MQKRYINYHKHTMYSNLRTLDCIVKPEDYIKRAVELGHKEYVTTEHGFQGNIFEAYTLCQQYGLKCIYGVEAYYTYDATEKIDRTAYHIILIALTENAREEINSIMSFANTDGFYYKPRIGLRELLKLTPSEVIVTTACIASPMFKEGWEEKFFTPVHEHFKDNFFLEVQDHLDTKQVQYNQKIIELHRKTGIPIIHANDSHYIFPEDAKNRDLFLNAKGMKYEEENGFVLDYPDYQTIVSRYTEQGVLSKEEIIEALENTLAIDKSSGINLDTKFKIPRIVKEDSNKVLRDLINEGWAKERGNVPEEKWEEYIKQIKYEYKIIEDCGMADYFILDHYIVKRAVEKYGAVLTKSGRGSAVSFYINKLLGLTEIDRISAPITLYPTRFMSAERILSSKSIPDIDLNFSDVKPVIKASKDILGEDGIYYMVAYKPLQESSAFRLWCKAKGLDISEYDEVAKTLEDHLEDPKWKDLIDGSKVFRGVVESVAPSPCSFLLSNDPISKKIGLIKVGKETCCCLDGYNCDCYKYLKNDYLTVVVYEIIDKVYKLIGKPIDSIPSLLEKCDQKVWDIYAKGLTTTINQADSDYDKQILQKYKPTSLAEMSAYVAAIRPGFASLLNNFIERKPYSTGVKELDDILEDSFHYLMYQESIMKYLVWLGVEEKGTYDIIKKISKKKFKPEDLENLKKKLLDSWVNKLGSSAGFAETWKTIEEASRYSFNASHSLSVATDSIYGAYLKANYPLEYFTVVLTIYKGDLDRTAKLIKELPYFDIEILPIKFRHSRADYNMESKERVIYQGVSAIKYMNAEVAEDLYNLRNDKFDTFLDLIKVFTGNSRQLDILIRLGYFSEFGPAKTLLKTVEYYNEYQCTGKTKQFKKDSIPIEAIPYIETYATKESDTKYILEAESVEKMLGDIVSHIPEGELPLKDRLSAESEYLGYIATRIPGAAGNAFVTDLEAKGNNYRVTLYDLETGEGITVKLKKKTFQNTPISPKEIISYRIGEEAPWRVETTADGKKKFYQDFGATPDKILQWYGPNERWDR